MKVATSFKTTLATAHAGLIASRSCSVLRMIFRSRPSVALAISQQFTASLPSWEDPVLRPHGSHLQGSSANIPKNAPSEPAAEPAFLQKSVVMAHEQVGLHLTHRIKQNADQDQHTRATEELSHGLGHAKGFIQNDWDNRDGRQKDGARERDAAHGVVQILGCLLPRPHAWDITAVFLQIIGHLQFIELRGHPEIGEE